jgi:MarR family transcriptional regulator, organic hydroperoxide resistance regulator
MDRNLECCDQRIKRDDQDNRCVDEVGEVVQNLVRVFQIFERDQIKVYGFTTTQCYTIFALNKFGTLTMNELSEKMNLSTSTMTRILDNLVRDKYIIRERDDKDRRIVIVSLATLGVEAAGKLNNSVNQYYKKIIDSLPQGQVDNVLNSVKMLQEAFEKANPNCC